jgi:hypothetical protein
VATNTTAYYLGVVSVENAGKRTCARPVLPPSQPGASLYMFGDDVAG